MPGGRARTSSKKVEDSPRRRSCSAQDRARPGAATGADAPQGVRGGIQSVQTPTMESLDENAVLVHLLVYHDNAPLSPKAILGV